jgi:hypothetical protein
MRTDQGPNTSLPTGHDLKLIYALSLVIALLMAAASLAGILYSSAIYPSDELVRTFVPNDVVSISIGLPILLGSIRLARRGRLIGLLCWPGALFFVLYNYIVYVFAMPLNVAFLLHLALVAMSVYTLISLVASIDAKAVQQQLAGVVPERLAGGVLAGLNFCSSCGPSACWSARLPTRYRWPTPSVRCRSRISRSRRRGSSAGECSGGARPWDM